VSLLADRHVILLPVLCCCSDEEAAGPSEAEEDAAAPAPQQQQGRKTALKGHKVKHGAVIKKSISKGHSSSKRQRSGKLRKK
jgi:hypothetical protein